MADSSRNVPAVSIGRGRGRGRGLPPPAPGQAVGQPATGHSQTQVQAPGRPAPVELPTTAMRSMALSGPGTAPSMQKPVATTTSMVPGFRAPPPVQATPIITMPSVPKPPLGKVGPTIQLRSNFFPLHFQGSVIAYQYRIDLKEPYRPFKREEAQMIFWELVHKANLTDNKYALAYDGVNTCYSLDKLRMNSDHQEFTIKCRLPRDSLPNDYQMSFKSVSKVTIDFTNAEKSQLSLMLVDAICRQYYNLPESVLPRKPFCAYGRNFYYIPRPEDGNNSAVELGGGRQAWTGYFLSARICMGHRPMLNIDIAHSAFIKPQSVLQFMCDILNQKSSNNAYRIEALSTLKSDFRMKPSEIMTFLSAAKGVRVTCDNAPQRHFTIRQVTAKAASEITFEFREGDQSRTISVADYFAKKNRNLRFPFLPCLEVGSKKRPSYLPLEVCNVLPCQRVSKKLTEQQTATMIKGSCTDAVTREKKIMSMIEKAGVDRDEFSKAFGINVNVRMAEMNGRIIPPPPLEYQRRTFVPDAGAWKLSTMKLLNPAKISRYGVISFIDRRHENNLSEFCKMLMDTASTLGLTVVNKHPSSVKYVPHPDKIRSLMQECYAECTGNGGQCDLILVLMDMKSTQKYALVKIVAEKYLGVVTQCVIQRNIIPAKVMTCENIVLKINAKMGGVNCKIGPEIICKKYLVECPTLVLGLDVTHPAPTDRKSPSIGAAVGNIDLWPAKFGASICVQKHRRESVIYLTEAIQKRISAFYINTQRRPERIIVYRDGVSEGQFNEILTEEVKNIRMACTAIGGSSYTPTITFIVVQKRHHARLFCRNQRDMSGRGKNVPPGTVVDDVITEPNQFDFYLCSHMGIQGTSRPAHYRVLLDENHFNHDELQVITYSLCHIYARCTRSVSIPAPTYYAHLACARARHHLFSLLGDATVDFNSDCGSITDSVNVSEQEMRDAVTLLDATPPMYFC